MRAVLAEKESSFDMRAVLANVKSGEDILARKQEEETGARKVEKLTYNCYFEILSMYSFFIEFCLFYPSFIYF